MFSTEHDGIESDKRACFQLSMMALSLIWPVNADLPLVTPLTHSESM